MSDFSQLLLAAVVLAILAGAAVVWLVATGRMEVKLHKRPEPRNQAAATPERGRM